MYTLSITKVYSIYFSEKSFRIPKLQLDLVSYNLKETKGYLQRRTKN